MNNAQCRMARAGLNLSIAELGKLAGVRTMTISKLERGGVVASSTAEKLRQWFVSQGVEFINGGKLVGARVPRKDTLVDLKDARAAHRKVTKLIGEMKKAGR